MLLAVLEVLELYECNHNPTSTPLMLESMRFTSSKFLKIETAMARKPNGSTRANGALAFGLRWTGGGERDRTDDLLLAKQALSQLSYTPDKATGGSGWIRTIDPRLIKTVL
jgi:hypothetical protein